MTPPEVRTSGGSTQERPYQSLYRRYRPQRFSEVRGQEHVTRSLRNAVRDGRVGHAYLFSGPRGTGKTSTARILAKALNCAAPAEGEPCGTCDSCRSIVAGTSFDVHELDAASNNGVEAMRDLVARAVLATPGRWKVYIVDEVHMLSTAASNALLKTLEEPPAHVVFVLATTDPQKVLPTIRSRTQHFEFHLLDDQVLGRLLDDVVRDAGLDLPEGGIGLAVRRGRGSARDALSTLDQVVAGGVVEDNSDDLAALLAGVSARDTGATLAALDAAIRGGRDPQQLAVDLVERLRAGFLALVAPGAPRPASLVGTAGSASVEEARKLGTARCVRAIELLGAAIVAMRDSPDPRITLEVALVRVAHPEADESVESLLDRLAGLERRLERLEHASPGPASGPAEQAASTQTPTPSAPPPSQPPPRDSPRTAGGRAVLGAYRNRPADAPGTDRPAGTAPAAGAANARAAQGVEAVAQTTPTTGGGEAAGAGAEAATAPPLERDALVAAWGDHILVGLRPKVRAYYQAGRFLGVEGGRAVFGLPNAVHVSQAEPLRAEVVAALSAYFGRRVELHLVVEGDWQDGPGEALAPEPLPGADLAPEPVPEPPPSGLSWEEDRLLKAFPGAEEV